MEPSAPPRRPGPRRCSLCPQEAPSQTSPGGCRADRHRCWEWCPEPPPGQPRLLLVAPGVSGSRTQMGPTSSTAQGRWPQCPPHTTVVTSVSRKPAGPEVGPGDPSPTPPPQLPAPAVGKSGGLPGAGPVGRASGQTSGQGQHAGQQAEPAEAPGPGQSVGSSDGHALRRAVGGGGPAMCAVQRRRGESRAHPGKEA